MTNARTIKVLIITKDRSVLSSLVTSLSGHGFDPLTAYSIKEGLITFRQAAAEAVIIRYSMLEEGGANLARRIREMSDVPIVFISDRAERAAVQQALTLGDDFMAPPWNWDRLAARLKALVKRYAQNRRDLLFYADDALHLDIVNRKVALHSQAISLTDTEFRLLSYLVRKANNVLSYETLARHVWGAFDPRVKGHLSRYIGSLRHLIEEDPADPQYVLTARGVGYWFRPQAAATIRFEKSADRG